jgi:hypothetical protein
VFSHFVMTSKPVGAGLPAMAVGQTTSLSDPKTPDQLIHPIRLPLQLGTSLQRRVQVFHALLVQRVDFGDVDIQRLDH